MKRLRLSPLAKSDLADIRHYIRQDKPTAADRQIARFFQIFRTLVKNPELGQRRPEFGPVYLRVFSGLVCCCLSTLRRRRGNCQGLSGYRDIEALFGTQPFLR